MFVTIFGRKRQKQLLRSQTSLPSALAMPDEIDEQEMMEEKWRGKLRCMRRNSCVCSRCGPMKEREKRLNKIVLEYKINDELDRKMDKLRCAAKTKAETAMRNREGRLLGNEEAKE